MKININEFRVHKPLVLDKYREVGVDYIGFYAAVAMVPVIALYCYVREEFPEDEEVSRRIQCLIEFYRYEGVDGERT